MSHKLRHDDPVYYKNALRGLLSEAKENGLSIDIKIRNINEMKEVYAISFENDIGEITEVLIG